MANTPHRFQDSQSPKTPDRENSVHSSRDTKSAHSKTHSHHRYTQSPASSLAPDPTQYSSAHTKPSFPAAAADASKNHAETSLADAGHRDTDTTPQIPAAPPPPPATESPFPPPRKAHFPDSFAARHTTAKCSTSSERSLASTEDAAPREHPASSESGNSKNRFPPQEPTTLTR